MEDAVLFIQEAVYPASRDDAQLRRAPAQNAI
jgi:hypothetical protein